MSDISSGAIPLVTILTALSLAATIDLQESRVPNWLVAGLLIAGLTFSGLGFTGHTLLLAAAGSGVGLLLLLPFYVLGGMGAGDVKLMSASGSFLGPWGAGYGVLSSLILGSVAAIVYALYLHWRRSSRVEAAESGDGTVEELSIGQTRFPYAPCIAVGVASVAIYQYQNIWSVIR